MGFPGGAGNEEWRMTDGMVKIENGFAEVGAGSWLMGRGQPAAYFGEAARRGRRGWRVPDRAYLDLFDTTGAAKCADSTRPFLTHIPCAAHIFAVSPKVLLAPAAARMDAKFVKAVPMSAMGSLCVTEFGQPEEEGESRGAKTEGRDGGNAVDAGSSRCAWVVMATASRTARVALGDDETLSVRPEAVVAWTGRDPTGFCRKLSVWNVLLPRRPRDLLFTFYGPGVVWIEGASLQNFKLSKLQTFNTRRVYGI